MSRYVLAVVLVVGCAVFSKSVARADLWSLSVTYTGGVVEQGPLSMGLSELPTSVTATFLLQTPDAFPTFGPANLISASLPFGDGTFDAGDLHTMTLIPQYNDQEEVLDFTTLSYRMGRASDGHLNPWLDDIGIDALADPCISRWPTTFCRIGRNSDFELNLFALDAATDEFVHYRYFTSEQSLTKVPGPSVLALSGSGLVGLLVAGRRMTRRAV